MPKRTASLTRSALLTAVSTAVVSGSAAVAGVVLARELGRSAETDGFFAAYGVYLVLLLAASAFRVVVLPPLARAADGRRLGGETLGWAAALAALGVPALALAAFGSAAAAGVLIPGSGREAAAESLRWLLPAAVAQLYAALLAGALAALDDYGTAAAGFAAGALAGLGLFVALVDEHGVLALAWGLALNGGIAVAVPLAALIARGALEGIGGATRVGPRLRALGEGVALPLALQGLFLVSLRLAGGLGVGSVTDFSYAYLIASFLVAVTASSLSLVSSVPLARTGLEGGRAARHVVGTSWLSIAAVAGAAGVFALAGEPLVRLALGDAFRGEGVGGVVVALSPWAAVTVVLSLAFPLLFVAGRTRLLPALAGAALVAHVPVSWAGREAGELAGLAVALGATTALVVVALLAALGALGAVARGMAAPVAWCGGLAVVCFALAGLALGPVAGAAVGLAAYAGGLSLARPRGLREAVAYVRAPA